MNVRHGGIKVGKDGDGVFFVIPFSKDMVEKVYVDEFFEEAIESGVALDIEVVPHIRQRARPKAFHDFLEEEEIQRVRKELDLRESYIPPRDDLNVYKYLDRLRREKPPSMAFTASTPEEHREWAAKVIEKVKKLTHYDLGKVPLVVEEGPETELRGVILKKLYFTSAPHLKVPAILARPKDQVDPAPGIVCVHGHNKGKINTIGMLESASNSYYGIELATRGYVTISLDQWGWGETAGYNKKREGNPEEVFSLSALLLGMTAIGIRCWNVSRAIDFLETLDCVSGGFGIIGQSGGGTTASFSSVMDDRIDASVISGYFCDWEWSIFAMRHCACNHVPGILQYINQSDMVAARAPRPTFIVAGDSDPIFPLAGVKQAYEKVKKAFQLYDKEDLLGIDIIPRTGHVFRGDKAYPWLDRVFGRDG